MQTLQDIQMHANAKNPNVYTHYRVDVDNLLSLHLYSHLIGCPVTELNINFVPTDIETIPYGAVGLDLRLAGFKGEASSCFEEMVKGLCDRQNSALRALAQHATLQDKGKLYNLPKSVQRGVFADHIAALRGQRWRDGDFIRWSATLYDAYLYGNAIDSHRGAELLDNLASNWLTQRFDSNAASKAEGLSQFESLVSHLINDDRLALSEFAQYVSLETTGKIAEQPNEVRIGLLVTQLALLESLGLELDAIRNWAWPVFDAQYSKGHSRLVANRAVATCTQLANGRIVVLDQRNSDTGAAFDMGADYAIYSSCFGVGIVRRSELTEPHLNILREPIREYLVNVYIAHLCNGEEANQRAKAMLDGFFFHEDGYICAWGTRKSPATMPCPISPVELAKLLEKVV